MDFKQNSVYPDVPPNYEGSGQQPTAPAAPVIIMQQPPQQPLYGSEPMMTTCPSCHERRMTRVNHKPSTKTHLIAVILCVTTCCCCIPYCINSCQSAEHICGNCGAYLGTYNN